MRRPLVSITKIAQAKLAIFTARNSKVRFNHVAHGFSDAPHAGFQVARRSHSEGEGHRLGALQRAMEITMRLR